jgi:hypothetical protein
MTPPMLGVFKSSEGLRLAARLGDVSLMDKIPFSKWWDQAVFTTPKGVSLSRKNVTYRLRSKYGGANIDAVSTDEAYESLRNNPGQFSVTVDGEAAHLARIGVVSDSGDRATMRQIAHELEAAMAAVGY